MLQLLTSDPYKYSALAVMLLAILYGYRKGRDAVSASGQSLVWTHVPLIAFAIASIGPSVFAIIIYLGYTSGLFQPGPSGYRFSTFVLRAPFDFAVINWGFVALYLTCRLLPNFGYAKYAMWFSVVVMSLPNILLFSLAWEMVSDARDAGQGIGIISAMISFPIIAMIWPGPLPDFLDPDSGSVFGFIVSVLTAPIPIAGLIGWLVGQTIGWTVPDSRQKTTVRS